MPPPGHTTYTWLQPAGSVRTPPGHTKFTWASGDNADGCCYFNDGGEEAAEQTVVPELTGPILRSDGDKMPMSAPLSNPNPKPKLTPDSTGAAPARAGDRAVILRSCDGDGAVDVVVDALKWNVADRSQISVEDISGKGGAKTYKVSPPDSRPPVVVHLRQNHRCNGDPLGVYEPRLAAAVCTFSKHGVAPQRLAGGSSWWIETYDGVPVGDSELKLRTAGGHRLKLTLVPKDSSDRIILEHAATLRALFKSSGGYDSQAAEDEILPESAVSSDEVALTLASHPG